MIVFENQTVTFVCIIQTEMYIDTNWDINGERHWYLTSEATRRRNQSRISTGDILGEYLFFLPARRELNNSRILCRYTPDLIHFTCSHTATLTIQGNSLYNVCLHKKYFPQDHRELCLK